MKNYLRLRASRRNTINAVIAFWGECCCLGTQSCKTIIQKYFDDRLCSDNISDAVNEISPLLVKLFRLIAQSHMTFLMRLEEFIHKMHFHLPLFTLTLFRTSQKPPQASVKTFLRIKGFLFEIWHFHHSFLMRYFKMRIKTGFWKPS